MRNQGIFWLILGVLGISFGYGCDNSATADGNYDIGNQISEANDWDAAFDQGETRINTVMDAKPEIEVKDNNVPETEAEVEAETVTPYDKDNDGYISVKYEGKGLCEVYDPSKDQTGKELCDCDDNDPSINPGAEEKCDNVDNNCDGKTDEDLKQTKYSGPEGTLGKGICKEEIQKCVEGKYTVTQEEVLPQNEACDGVDNDCNNIIEDGSICCDPDGDGIITNKFKDANLLAAIRNALGKGPNEDITLQDALQTTSLDLLNKGIKDISGIECFTNLTELNLGNNQISDLAPLAGLTNLTDLYLWANQISNLWPLASLTNLALLKLDENQISDLTPLANLTNLTKLWLHSNQISNILPLINNPGLGAGDVVYLADNPQIPVSQIDALKAKGVKVDWP